MILIIHFYDQEEPTAYQKVFDIEAIEHTDILVALDDQLRKTLILPTASYSHIECLYEDEDDTEAIH